MALWKIMKPPMWAAFRAVSRINLLLRGGNYRYIFILGHMRSGSTLLTHILANQPDVVGAGEMHLTYRTPTDLFNLAMKTCETLHRPILRELYLVDQINHDYVSDETLLAEQIHKCIILLREPEATLRSMAALKNMNSLPWKETQALKHYVERLETLTRYGFLLRDRACLIEYDSLVDQTSETLTKLTSFLGLNTPLTSSYTTNRMTGRVAGVGDPSDNIKIGRVIRTRKHEITLSDETLLVARAAFSRCREQLQIAVKSAER
jgi:hypothetical protein